MGAPFGPRVCTCGRLSREGRICTPRRRVHELQKMFLLRLSPKADMNPLIVEDHSRGASLGVEQPMSRIYVRLAPRPQVLRHPALCWPSKEDTTRLIKSWGGWCP